MLAALALCADLQWSMLLGDRTEARARQARGHAVGFDLATLPSVRIEGQTRRTRLSFSYAPLLTLRDLQATRSFEVLHSADLSLSWQARRFSLAIGESVSYGDFNFGYLTPQTESLNLPRPSPQALPTALTLRFGSSRTGAFLRWTWRRTALAIAPSYSIAGGLDEASRALVPVSRTPRIDVSVQTIATRRDLLTTEASGQFSESTARACDPTTGGPPIAGSLVGATCSPRNQIAELRESWRHKLARHSDLSMGVGAAMVRAQIDSSSDPNLTFMPTGYLIVSHDLTLGRTIRPKIELGARVAPLVDIRYQIVEPRLEAWASWFGTVGRTSFITRVSVLRSLPKTLLDVTAVSLSSEVTRTLNRRFDIGTGVRGTWQRDNTYGANTFVTYFVSLSWHEPRIRF